jgi:hypothetical protein
MDLQGLPARNEDVNACRSELAAIDDEFHGLRIACRQLPFRIYPGFSRGLLQLLLDLSAVTLTLKTSQRGLAMLHNE